MSKKLPRASSSSLVRHARNAEQTDPQRHDPDHEFLRNARARFTAAQAFGGKQKKRENEDRKFFAGEQWSEDVKTQRAGHEAENGLPPIPARPCLTVNLQREKVQQVVNGLISADIGFEIVPADDFGSVADPPDETEIELREGLARRIQRTSSAEESRLWGAKNAVIAGQGYWGVNVRYGDGKTADQEIYIERYYDQNAVALGPHHEPDGSDTEYGFVGLPMPLDEYNEKYPRAAKARKDGDDEDNASALLTDNEFDDFSKAYPEWFTIVTTTDAKTKEKSSAKYVLVVRYYYYTRTSRDLAMFSDGRAEWVNELPSNAPKDSYTTRRVVLKQVKFADIDGARVLERGDWAGPDIPIVKVVADELPPFDGEYRCEGQVRPSTDGQKGFNFMLSRGVEMVAVTPIPPLELDPEAIQGYEQWYWYAATRVLPYLPYRTRGDDGREFRPPARPNVEPNIQPVAAFFQVFRDAIQSTTSVHEPSVGKVDPRLRSGKAIGRVIQQDEYGTSHIVDNYARSIHREATIVNNLLYPIYGRVGRMARIINGQNEPQTIPIGQPFTMQNGRPTLTTDTTQGAKTYHLSPDAKFNIAMKVTKNHDLKRDQLAEFLSGLIEANPQMMEVFGDKFFEALDVPDRRELVERAKAMLAPPIQQMLAAKKQGMDIPPLIQQQMAQGQKMIEGLTQTVQKLEQAQATDQVKAENQLRIEQMKAQNDIRLKEMELEKERMSNATEIEVARIQAASKGMIEAAKLQAKEEELATGIVVDAATEQGAQSHEAAMKQTDQAHERTMQRDTHQHDTAMSAADAGVASDEAERGRQHDASMGVLQHASAIEQQKAKPKPNGKEA
jgi:hypothetical protein